jgi:hypothetical protein
MREDTKDYVSGPDKARRLGGEVTIRSPLTLDTGFRMPSRGNLTYDCALSYDTLLQTSGWTNPHLQPLARDSRSKDLLE